MFVLCNNPLGYKEHIISFIVIAFGDCLTIVDWMVNMNTHLSDIMKSYEDTIIGYFVNASSAELLIHIVQCWHDCYFD